MMGDKDTITMSELSRRSGITASTIRYYLKEGLISQPRRTGKTRAYFNKEHIKQLRKLKRLRNTDQLSIREIKHSFGVLTSDTRENGYDQSLISDRKGDIIAAAIELFRSKGYDNISINDIAERASISKGTFYKHFTGKEDLFYECADRVFFNMDAEFEEILKEEDVVNRLAMRGSLFLKTREHILQMLNVARGAFTENTPLNSEKLRQIQTNMAGPIADDLNEGIKKGVFRKIDAAILSHMLVGAAEYGIYYCEGKSESEIDHFIRQVIDILLKGLNPGPAEPL
jgi:AcrR family transcriptional regulator